MCPVRARTQDGHTPLHAAALQAQLACVQLLLERGADKDAKNIVRAHAPTPRRAASERGRRRFAPRAACAASCAPSFDSAVLTWRCTPALVAAAALRAQNGKTPLELIVDESDDADACAANAAVRALFR
jgi:ankyrin repeat protein